MKIKEFEKRARINGGYDREFDEWKILDIHEIPYPVLEQYDTDFYCCNGKGVFLLRLSNREKESYRIVHHDHGYPPYLCAEMPISKIDEDLIKRALSKFEID